MDTSALGLPLEYQKLPQYFDAWNINEDTDLKNSIIEKLLKKQKVQSVLDFTCGTGSQVFFLKKRGYSTVGADFSPGLLEIARARASRENLDITFIDGDMRILKVAAFDAVITIFNAIGHLVRGDFEKALCNIHSNLKEGGIYIFDILNLEAMTDESVADLSYFIHKKVGDTQILSTQCSTLDREKGILTCYDTIMLQKNAERPERLHNTFSLQLYTEKELRHMLERNGFEMVDVYDMDGAKFIANESPNILTVARKK